MVSTLLAQSLLMAASLSRKIGIVGYGKLGQYLANSILEAPASAGLEIAFVWNRTSSKIKEDGKIKDSLVLEDLGAFAERGADLIVEVAHPAITEEYGAQFLEHADFFCGSPTCFADRELEERIRAAAEKPNSHGLYVPAGALWGAMDIQKMAWVLLRFGLQGCGCGSCRSLSLSLSLSLFSSSTFAPCDAHTNPTPTVRRARGQLKGLKVTMKKHPSSFRVYGEVAEKLAAVHATAKKSGEDEDASKALEGPPGEHILYEGPVRALCPLAPNNVNTMACAALASGDALGFDGTQSVH